MTFSPFRSVSLILAAVFLAAAAQAHDHGQDHDHAKTPADAKAQGGPVQLDAHARADNPCIRLCAGLAFHPHIACLTSPLGLVGDDR